MNLGSISESFRRVEAQLRAFTKGITSTLPIRSYLEGPLDLLFPRRRELKRLREKWGLPGSKKVVGVRRYFDLICNSSGPVVDDKTWVDLELPKVFESLDSTESPLGSQYLYYLLRMSVGLPDVLTKYHKSCQALRNDPALREEIQLQLSKLKGEANAQIADGIFGAAPIISPMMRLLPWWSIACVGILAVVVTTNLSIWIWFATLGINLLLIFKFTVPLHRELDTLRGCHRLLRVAEALAAIPDSSSDPDQLADMRAQTAQRARALTALRLTSSLQGTVAAYLTVWLNLAFLAEISACVRTIRKLEGIRFELASTFQLVGSLDAMVAVASYLERHQAHCTPVFSEGRRLELVDGCHPLIACPVSNTINLNQRSVLVTGSNMAGKTTFIKMVGINVILGRSLGFCLATSAVIPAVAVMASIRREHSVESGKSNYFAELEVIRDFITKSRRGECGLFLIDELFSGTNTVERLAASRVVLECLADQSLVVATTHDVELQGDLENRYDLYYFEEDPDVDGYFDYRLRLGRSSRRNAIRLLEREGFPGDIVIRAMQYAENYGHLSS